MSGTVSNVLSMDIAVNRGLGTSPGNVGVQGMAASHQGEAQEWFILLEDGSGFIRLEDDSGNILLESAP